MGKFYLQDTRGFVGNSMLWWAVNDCGYTCDIRCARVWTQKDLEERFELSRWPLPSKYKIHVKEEIDRLVQHHIDFQDLSSDFPHTIRQWRPDLIEIP